MENFERTFTKETGIQSFPDLFSNRWRILKDSLQRRLVFSHFWIYCERQFTKKIGVQSFLELFSILKDGEFRILKDSLQRRMVLSFADFFKNIKNGEF